MVGTYCSGVTTIADAGVGRGDYLEITTLQPGTGTSTTVSGTASRICGLIFNGASAQTSGGTVCSYAIPFRVGVHMDSDENISAPGTITPPDNFDNAENIPTSSGSGYGYSGFYLNYWQNSC